MLCDVIDVCAKTTGCSTAKGREGTDSGKNGKWIKERIEWDKGTKIIKERKAEGEELSYEKNHSPFNLIGVLPLVFVRVCVMRDCVQCDLCMVQHWF
jgi:hypothetical protein